MLNVLDNALILVTNDDEKTLHVLSRRLRQAGCRVLEARDGKETLRLTLERVPDAIVLSGKMPDISATEVCRILRRSPEAATIPIVQVSAAPVTHADKMRGIEGGADVCLVAPYDPLELLIHLGVLLRTRQAEQRFRLVARATGTLIYDVDFPGGTSRAVEGLERLLGCSPEEVEFSVNWWCRQIHPDDLSCYKKEREKLCASGLPHRMNYRVKTRDGSWIEVEDTAQATRNERGEAQRIVGGVVDVTERRHAEAQLKQAMSMLDDYNHRLERAVGERTAKLQEMVQELEQFSYSLVHDMRAPLRALQAFGQLLLVEENEVAPEMRREYLQRLTNASRRMDMLITDALSFSRAVLRPMPLKTINPGSLLQSIIDTYPGLQPYKHAIHILPPLPLVQANEAGLTQCFSNLLENAVKFTRPGVPPVVRVWAEEKKGQIRIWFEDNGTGIPTSFRTRLFAMFARGAATGSGTGIGLALVRKNAERMGGRVGVESQEGKGSRFWIELPAAAQVRKESAASLTTSTGPGA
jgi:PAS domain S-box-containing protein